ncbi:MAG TPA: SusF/SusE family outer membrane protein [Gillisia sp.]|nr:SusF/SusE family outer membrane protein [Gillisia sp.]
MKKLSVLLLAFVAFSGIYSCSSDDDVVFIAQPDVEGINFTNSFNANYILTPGTATNVAERFVWNTVNFETPTNITYELQGSTDTDFNNFDVMGTTGDNNLSVTVQQMMNLAMDSGLDADRASEASNSGALYFRVIAYAGDNTGNSNAQNSEVKSITVILPEDAEEEEAPLKNLFLVGDATAAGWNPNNNNTPLFRSADNPNVYNYTGYFGAGEFKLLEVRDWQPQWGLDNGSLSNSDILGGDPGSFLVSTAGFYTFTINIDEMSYSFEPYDASGADTYASIGVIGDATADGWDADQDMTQSAFDAHVWYISGIELGDGEMKFRANDAWDVDWGGDTAMSGVSSFGGPNIPVSAGTYDIWFNDITRRYIFIPIISD